MVYSVLYSDVKQGFVYGEDEGRDDGHVSISYREEEARRGRKVGYYGIVELSDETSRTKEKPVIDWVRLVNGDSLSLEFRLTENMQKSHRSPGLRTDGLSQRNAEAHAFLDDPADSLCNGRSRVLLTMTA